MCENKNKNTHKNIRLRAATPSSPATKQELQWSAAGDLRPILDLWNLNKHLRKYKFKMLMLRVLSHFIHPRDLLTSKGSKGFIFSHKHLPGTQKIPQVCLSRHSLQTFGSSFQALISPENVEQLCRSSFDLIKNSGSQSVSLFRLLLICSCVSFKKKLRFQNK